jgi:hypothetical protein
MKLGKKGVVRKRLIFHTWTYTSFNFLHDLFYCDLLPSLPGQGKAKLKKVPRSIGKYLTALALAI